jgi:anti-sigma regulatory factor (Ser/Thr protein kinase)
MPRPDPGGEPRPDGAPRPELRLDLPAAHAAARMARHLVRKFARESGLDGSELEHLVLIADELLTNAVDHGGGGGSMEETDLERPVRMGLVLAIERSSWEIRVSDQGGGDPRAIDALIHPPDLPDLDNERGRGFFLMAQMVDALEVRRSEDGLGLVLIARRRFGGSR